MINRGRRAFTIILIIILVIGLSLGGYLLYRYISDYYTRKEAAQAVDEFENIITVAIGDDEENNTIDNQEQEQEQPTGQTQPTRRVTYKTFSVAGTISIPKTGAKYPIVIDNTPAAMESAVVLLYGPGLNQVGNTVIAGHNYRNGNFFGKNRSLVNGDKIYITDIMGNKVEYTIYRKYETSDADFSYATRNTNGKMEISLSTCTSNASTRLIIWAKESE